MECGRVEKVEGGRMLIYEIAEAAKENPDIKIKCPNGKILTVLDPYFQMFQIEGLDGFITAKQLMKVFGSRAEYEIMKAGDQDA